jgi:DNA-binding winged helix-turn-helix (wHTH) protein
MPCGPTIDRRTGRASGVTPLMNSVLARLLSVPTGHGTRTLARDGEEVLVGKPHLAFLILFTSRSRPMIPKDVLMDTVWRGVALTTNSLSPAKRSTEKALRSLRVLR